MPNYSGMWTLQAQYQANSQGLWPVLPPTGGLWVSGANNKGQLGQSDVVYRSSPVQIASSINWSKFHGASDSTLAIKNDGTMWSWGYNAQGQLGLNSTVNRSSPVQIGALTTWSEVGRGGATGDFNLAINSSGALWAWGGNGHGQLGQNDATYRSSPVQVGALTNWSNLSTGGFFWVALKTDGTIWSCGRNNVGQLGNTSIISRSSPVQIGALTTWSSIYCGNDFVIALRTDGTLWSWGNNDFGQLGILVATTQKRSSPVQIGALTTWSSLGVGYNHVLATTTSGTLWGWGDNNQGQLGLSAGDTYAKSSPVQVGSVTTWSKVAGGSYFTVANRTDGTLWGWGKNSEGQLGLGDRAQKNVPNQVGSLNSWGVVDAGGYGLLALRTS